jgi:hypothetical protein
VHAFATVYGLVFGFDTKAFEAVTIMDCRKFESASEAKKVLETAVRTLESTGVKCIKNQELVDWTCSDDNKKIFTAILMKDLKKCKEKPANDAKMLKLLIGQ